MEFQLPASKANLNDICPFHVVHVLSIANKLGSITGFDMEMITTHGIIFGQFQLMAKIIS